MLKFSRLLLFASLPLAAALHADDELHDEVAKAIAAGKKEIVLTQKEYRISKPLFVTEWQGITLDGNGALFTVTGDHAKKATEAMIITGKTRDCTFKNFSIDYDPVPFTQGVITSVEGQQLNFILDSGYPNLLPGKNGGCHTHIFTPDGKHWKPGQNDVYGWVTFDPRTRTGFVSVENNINVEKVAKGDRIAIDWRGRCGAAAIDMHGESGRNKFENITILAAPGVCFRCYHGEGEDVYRNVKIVRGPQRPGLSKPRLLSSVADGIHYGYCRKGITIDGCELSYMGDDALNLHGACLHVCGVKDANTFYMIKAGNYNETILTRMKSGDKIRVLDPKTYKVLGFYTYESSRWLPGKQLPVEEAKKLLFRACARWANGVHRVYAVKIKEKVDFPTDAIFDVPSLATSTYKITDSYFHDHRAYGLRVMSCNGLVEKCRFERIKGAAVAASAQYHFWGECGWTENVTIRNNVIKACGNCYGTPDSIVNGAISFTAQLADYSKTPQEHRRVTIENNTISDTTIAGIFLLGVREGTVRGNTLIRTGHGTPAAGNAIFGNACRKPIVLWHCGKLDLRKNTIK